ncbi:uncharacterized protein G2W53_033360 [Senna tora]|uniref:Uncharacterized protein n=1 Tax=Senna tora TaxID=362788 RepID=A0A834T9F8_9FABA|nr:uncharacterized protein G2W53_033360 [Senna tora]
MANAPEYSHTTKVKQKEVINDDTRPRGSVWWWGV